MDLVPLQNTDVYLVRNLYGKVRVIAGEPVGDVARGVLADLAGKLSRELGAHGHPPADALLMLDASVASLLEPSSKILDRIFWADRMVTNNGWRTVARPTLQSNRYTLFSVKGGVGRSTTAAILAWHLARQGEHVLVVDLDMESPGLGSAVLDQGTLPEFGAVDWFVEDLVGQGAHVAKRMTGTPTWADDLEGTVTVVPAHGHGGNPGEYLTKLGRVHLNTKVPWTDRLNDMITKLETARERTIVLIESRSGLHDIAAATVTDLGAHTLLFATDSPSSWTDYKMLFSHWRDHDVAKTMRNRLSIVSALTPETDTEKYIEGFAEQSWRLFCDHLYDEISPSSTDDAFSFDLHESSAPHNPIPIHWNRGLATGSSLRRINVAPVTTAYSDFLRSFDSQLRPETAR